MIVDNISKFAAYVATKKHNVFMVEWHSLGRFPCYLSALYNMRLVAQCTAQLYAFIMENGGSAYETTCIGHSLGAHICGMISNHLTIRQHRIIGLDPARPLIDRFARKEFRLTPDDADQVQVIHTNAGFLGEINQVGTVDFCVNGGAIQPGCHGHMIRISRCSHFQSVCYLVQTVTNASTFVGQPCSSKCPRNNVFPIRNGKPIPMGEHTPKEARGMHCVKIEHDNDCPFN
ncbi:pancreatic lipase-related protein 2 [Agrilus planipennis]|uniref:Pancreatic lipase-related protein 2 n=1 Tax=Agrilus planipennis TaxID=224129 RepID=A0A1W4WZZ2_AGRPL|nr:pancreatic lipase-related protein 2 [Agrilus planipennis]